MSEQSDPRQRRSLGGILAILAILGITGATFGADLFVGESAEDEAPRRLMIDASFPSTSPSAAPHRVAIGKGRQTVVRVFDASCRACFRENEALAAVAVQHDTDLVAVAVGTSTSSEQAIDSATPTIADVDGELARRLGVDEPPMTLIIDVKGTVLERRASIPTAELGDLLDRARSRSTDRDR